MEEALKENSDNTHPYIICTGDIAAFSSAVAVCNKKVITDNIGQLIFSAFVTLLAIYFAYELDFNPNLKHLNFFKKSCFVKICLRKRQVQHIQTCTDRSAALSRKFWQLLLMVRNSLNQRLRNFVILISS